MRAARSKFFGVSLLLPCFLLACERGAPPATGDVVPIEAVGAAPPRRPADPPPVPPGVPIPLDQLGVVTRYGADQSAREEALLQKPLDAAFAGDHVLILDAAPPWVRRFDRDGGLVRAIAQRGDGPGEARRPTSLAATADGGFVLSHVAGIERFDAAGELLSSWRPQQRILGAVEACGGVLALVPDPAAPDTAVFIARLGTDGEVLDRPTRIVPVRRSGRNYHPWFVHASEDRILVFTEEEERSRLVEYGCAGETLRDVPLPALGPGESVTRRENLIGVRSPGYPFPAGLGRVDDHVLWVTRVLEGERPAGLDSVTVVTAVAPSGEARSLRVEGWYQLFSSDSDGSLLFTNAWTLGQNWLYPGTWGLYPIVLRVDGRTLLRRIEDWGERAGP